MQLAAGLRVDGIAGKDTWRVLGIGTLWQSGQKAMPAAPAAKATGAGHKGPAPAARPLVQQPAIPPAKPPAQAAAAKADIPSDDNVLSWSADKKFQAVAMRAVDRLPGATRDELLKLLNPVSIGVTLAFWAASHFVGIGEVVDLFALLVGAVCLGGAVFDVAHDLGHALTLTYNAATQAELDDAAGLLAHVIATIGVAALVALLASCFTNSRSLSDDVLKLLDENQLKRVQQKLKI